MPIYSYKCVKCNDQFEAKQSMSEDPLTVCIKCKGTLKKIIGQNIGIAFKGSGFYINDKSKKAESAKKTAPACTNGKCPGCVA